MSRLIIKISIERDYNFFALLPTLNINYHSEMLEIEWGYIGVYISISKDQQEEEEW